MVFEEKDKPRYIPGFVVVIVTSAVAGLLVIVYRYVCIWDNRKRDKAGTAEGFENAYQDDFTDKTVSIQTPMVNWFSFRLMLFPIECSVPVYLVNQPPSVRMRRSIARGVRSVGGSVGLSAPDSSWRLIFHVLYCRIFVSPPSPGWLVFPIDMTIASSAI